MTTRSFVSLRSWRLARWAGLAAAVPALWACTSRSFEAPVVVPSQSFQNKVVQKINNEIDILFMVDNSSSMTSMQQKLLAQLPLFMQVLQALPMGLPSVHVAVVSSDMGATSDANLSSAGCNNSGGNNGQFFSMPEDTCVGTTLDAGATFITDDGAGLTKNFSAADPNGIGTVFKCIALLGSGGCGFEQPLASIDRALGGDGQGPPALNSGFLRKEAYLGIVMLTNEDDCSTAASSNPIPVYSLNSGPLSVTNADGPVSNYRCNGGPLGGHLCLDPAGPDPTLLAPPPINPPPNAQGTAAMPTLDLMSCQDNTSGSSGLTPVAQFVSDIKGLKLDPENQILVGGIIAPTAPYSVVWLPGGTAGELWPQLEHSCGPAGATTNPKGQIVSDGSFGDPGVRETEFIQSFGLDGVNGVVASICDNSYAQAMTTIAMKLGQLIKPKCISGVIQQDASGQPSCTVTNEVMSDGKTKEVVVKSCAASGGAAPCWTLNPPDTTNNCPPGTQGLTVSPDPTDANPNTLDSLVECATCIAGIPNVPGCP
jgi:hypothetical protein